MRLCQFSSLGHDWWWFGRAMMCSIWKYIMRHVPQHARQTETAKTSKSSKTPARTWHRMGLTGLLSSGHDSWWFGRALMCSIRICIHMTHFITKTTEPICRTLSTTAMYECLAGYRRGMSTHSIFIMKTWFMVHRMPHDVLCPKKSIAQWKTKNRLIQNQKS